MNGLDEFDKTEFGEIIKQVQREAKHKNLLMSN